MLLARGREIARPEADQSCAPRDLHFDITEWRTLSAKWWPPTQVCEYTYDDRLRPSVERHHLWEIYAAIPVVALSGWVLASLARSVARPRLDRRLARLAGVALLLPGALALTLVLLFGLAAGFAQLAAAVAFGLLAVGAWWFLRQPNMAAAAQSGN
jgi:hypothetical protein